jgi:hypothetical protein
MGTRADFYVGKGVNAEWIGSVAWDGYEWRDRLKDGDNDEITSAKTEKEYRDRVASLLAARNDGTTHDMGWPWPWDDSRTTDCAYCFVDGHLEPYSWGCPLDSEDEQEWPNFADSEHSAKAGGSRSGVMLIGL